MSRHLLTVCVMALLCATTSGCARKIQVSGRLIEDGEPIKVNRRMELLRLTFQRIEDGTPTKDVFQTDVLDGGKFEIISADGKGIPAGRYRVSVQTWLGPGGMGLAMVKAKAAGGKDQARAAGPEKGRYQQFSMTETNIERDLLDDPTYIVIDLAKPEGE